VPPRGAAAAAAAATEAMPCTARTRSSRGSSARGARRQCGTCAPAPAAGSAALDVPNGSCLTEVGHAELPHASVGHELRARAAEPTLPARSTDDQPDASGDNTPLTKHPPRRIHHRDRYPSADPIYPVTCRHFIPG
jgi:hypothetical protein